jgi:putative peptidoglycan lipid II flippase
MLLVFFRKNPELALGRTLKSVLVYTFKMILFSALALVPVLLLSPRLSGLFEGRGRFISQGAPLFINAIVFACTGIFLLIITKDKQFLGIFRLLKKNKQ